MITSNSTMLKIIILIFIIAKTQAIGISLEAESHTDKKYMEVFRSSASGEKTIHLYKGDRLNLEYCLTSESLVQLKDIKYSNDGGSEMLTVSMDNDPVGKYHTIATYDGGKGWNKFRSLHNMTFSKVLYQGRHRVSIIVVDSDSFGVEIDMVYLEVPGSGQDVSSFHCNVFCFDGISYPDDLKEQTITQAKAKIVQRSVETQCAEEDNINIPVFHDSARKFAVTASYPKYMSFSNNRIPDWRNCRTLMASFWKFTNFNLLDNVDLKDKTAKVTSNWVDGMGMLEVDFSLEGQSTGSTDSEIGTDIHLKLEWLPENFNLPVSLSYTDRQDNVIQTEIELNSSSLNAKWTTPDFTFREGTDNKLVVKIMALPSMSKTIKVTEFYMFKRDIAPDKWTTIFDDGMTVIEGVDMDMWWRINETMTVMFDNGNIFGNIEYLRIYQKVPWSYSGYAQVFVIYQDGNVRLLPMTPHGLDWVPFGSSVLLGQSDPHSNRPSAPISHINIDPMKLNLKIFFKDGGVMNVVIKPKITETMLMITDAEYKKDLKLYPFFTFRSMWVADGNADVDHVTVDGAVTERIMSDWKEIFGTFVGFYRKCISKHNTLSPDISLKILD